MINQSYGNLEILISDDGSNDGSFEVIEKYRLIDSRIINLSNRVNKGLVNNFNKLFDHVNGEFIAFFSGDDVMLPNKIARQIEQFQFHEDVVLVHHDATIINANNEVLDHTLNRGTPILSAVEYCLDIDWFHIKRWKTFLPTTVCARSSYFLKSRYSSEFTRKHELLFYLENHIIDPKGKWLYIQEKLIKYRDHDENFTNNNLGNVNIALEREKLVSTVAKKFNSFSLKSRNALYFLYNETLLFNHKFVDKSRLQLFRLLLKSPNYFFFYVLARFTMFIKIYWPVSKLLHKYIFQRIFYKRNEKYIIP